MPCPICTHTMQNLGVESQRVFWCPRCGTVKMEVDPEFDNVSIPRLVGYVRSCEETTILTSVDHKTLQYAIPERLWRDVCEAVGVKAHDMSSHE